MNSRIVNIYLEKNKILVLDDLILKHLDDFFREYDV